VSYDDQRRRYAQLKADRGVVEQAAARLRHRAVLRGYVGLEHKEVTFALALILDEITRHLRGFDEQLRAAAGRYSAIRRPTSSHQPADERQSCDTAPVRPLTSPGLARGLVPGTGQPAGRVPQPRRLCQHRGTPARGRTYTVTQGVLSKHAPRRYKLGTGRRRSLHGRADRPQRRAGGVASDDAGRAARGAADVRRRDHDSSREAGRAMTGSAISAEAAHCAQDVDGTAAASFYLPNGQCTSTCV
jgi:hypothetical protein